MRNQEWYASLSQLYPLDLAKLVFCLFTSNTVDGKAALCVVDKTEVFPGLLDANDVHETSRVGRIGAHFSIDFD